MVAWEENEYIGKYDINKKVMFCCKICFIVKEINWVENVCDNFVCGYLCRCVIYF